MDAADFVKLPPVKWAETLEAMQPEARYALGRQLDNDTERCALAAGYVNARHCHGISDKGHAAAVKAANRLATKIRSALGYTYPRRDIHF